MERPIQSESEARELLNKVKRNAKIGEGVKIGGLVLTGLAALGILEILVSPTKGVVTLGIGAKLAAGKAVTEMALYTAATVGVAAAVVGAQEEAGGNKMLKDYEEGYINE